MLSTALPPFSALLVPTPQAWVRFIAGRVPAGFPSPAEDHLVERIDLMTKLVRHPQATFFVRIKGDSMRDAGILDGSVVMVDKAIKPRHGHIVIAIVDGDFTCTLEEARQLSTVAAGFDADGYKILVRPILTQSVEILPL